MYFSRMKKIVLMAVLICFISAAKAQRLSFDELEAALNSSMDKAQENLFLKGYSLVSMDTTSGGKVYTFSNRKKTVTTAKMLSKGFYASEPLKSFVQYVTYEALEFQKLRKLMIDEGFNRNDSDEISETSNYYKNNLEVSFKTDEVNGNRAFIVILRNRGLPAPVKVREKLRLKNIFGN